MVSLRKRTKRSNNLLLPALAHLQVLKEGHFYIMDYIHCHGNAVASSYTELLTMTRKSQYVS